MHTSRDQIWGTVREVVDRETLVVERVAGSRLNGSPYNDTERIHILALEHRRRPVLRLGWTQDELERRFLGERVELLVYARDDRGRVLAQVCW